jgi:hypothetical protein
LALRLAVTSRFWVRYCWAWPVSVWGIEVGGNDFDGRGRLYERRVKIGPICFGFGYFRRIR